LLQEWVTSLNSHNGGLQLWIDLDNAADSLEQLECAQVMTSHYFAPANVQSFYLCVRQICQGRQIQKRIALPVVRGFAGADYCGPAPSWLPMIRCEVRAKNGADFLLAFEAGKLAQKVISKNIEKPPTIIIVSADAGLNIVVKELTLVGIPSFLLINISELEFVMDHLLK
jgi:hypothetical protein